MPNLVNYNGRFCESEYEYAVLSFLEKEGWQYLSSKNVVRNSKSDVVINLLSKVGSEINLFDE